MKIRYLHIKDYAEMGTVKNIEPTPDDLVNIDSGDLTILKVIDEEFYYVMPNGNFESIKKDFINE